MNTETAFEVYSFVDKRWLLESRFGADGRDAAHALAAEMRRTPGVSAVKIVLELYDPAKNAFSETVIYQADAVHQPQRAMRRPQAIGTSYPRRSADSGGQRADAPEETDGSGLLVLVKLALVVAGSLAVSAAATKMVEQFYWLSSTGRAQTFVIVAAICLVIGAATVIRREDWAALLAEGPSASPQSAAPAASATPAQAATGPGTPAAAVPQPSAGEAEEAARKTAESDARRVKAEVQVLTFLQQCLADPGLAREDRSGFPAFIFSVGAVDALAREAGLPREDRLGILSTCGLALGIPADAVAETMENLPRLVARREGLAMVRAGLAAMLECLAGRPFASALAEALARWREMTVPPPAPQLPPATALALQVPEGPDREEVLSRSQGLVTHHNGLLVEVQGIDLAARFPTPARALVAALAIRATTPPPRPRMALALARGPDVDAAARALNEAGDGEIVAEAAFQAVLIDDIEPGDLPPYYRTLAPADARAAGPDAAPPDPAASAPPASGQAPSGRSGPNPTGPSSTGSGPTGSGPAGSSPAGRRISDPRPADPAADATAGAAAPPSQPLLTSA